MLNGIFLFIVAAAVLLAAAGGRMTALTGAMLESAGGAVTLAIGLVGAMTFFIGLMRVAQDAGVLRLIARAVAPVLRRLFPDVPPEHPALGAMLLNIGANVLGLVNAATPFGIKAIEELDALNGRKGTATDAMVLFLAINTSGLALLPSGVIALRASAGSANPAGIFLSTWVASGCATIVGVTAALLLSRLPRFRATRPPVVVGDPTAPVEAGDGAAEPAAPGVAAAAPSRFRALVAGGAAVLFVLLLARHLWQIPPDAGALEVTQDVFSYWLLPALVLGLLLFGWTRGVRVYDSLVEGGKEGFQVALRIIPYLVAILVAVGMLRAAGGIELMGRVLGPLTSAIGMPAEALPVALLRPLTGSGCYAIVGEILETHGPDSLLGYMVSTMQGGTETTFYVLAVYFGAVRVRATRHALPACLLADAAGMLAAIGISNLLFG